MDEIKEYVELGNKEASVFNDVLLIEHIKREAEAYLESRRTINSAKRKLSEHFNDKYD